MKRSLLGSNGDGTQLISRKQNWRRSNMRNNGIIRKRSPEYFFQIEPYSSNLPIFASRSKNSVNFFFFTRIGFSQVENSFYLSGGSDSRSTSPIPESAVAQRKFHRASNRQSCAGKFNFVSGHFLHYSLFYLKVAS